MAVKIANTYNNVLSLFFLKEENIFELSELQKNPTRTISGIE
jgi:hypothetical protein